MLRVWVHGCDPGRVSDGSWLALYQTLSIEWLDSLKHLCVTARGYQSGLIISLMGIQFRYLYLGLGSHVWLRSYIVLNSVLDRVCVWADVTWLPWLARSDEKW